MIFLQTDKIVFLSSEMFNLAQNYYKIKNSEVTIIPNGVKVPKLFRERNFEISNGIEIVFYNGLDTSRERGLNKLIKVITKINNNRIHLSILGHSTKIDYVSATFYDPMNEELLSNFLLTKHVFIDNLDYMPFSILALESMALGLVPIVSDKSGLASFINNGKNGFVYNSKNPVEICDILNDILIEKFDLEQISANAKNIFKQLNWENVARQYDITYRSIV